MRYQSYPNLNQIIVKITQSQNHQQFISSYKYKYLVLTVMEYQISNIVPEGLNQTFISQNKKQLQELLSCYICYERARGASMCPFCSKIYCQNCIKRSLAQKQECPNCRKSLKANSMTYCSRFINQLSFLLEELIQQKTMDQKCIQHNVQQNYYCRSCGLPICCQCEMFGQHKGHHIDNLAKIYQLKCQPVRQGLLALKKEIKEKESSIKQIQMRNNDLVKQKERRLAEIQQNNHIYKIRIFSELSEDQKLLEECSNSIKQKLQKLDQLQKELALKSNNTKLNSENDKSIEQEIEQIEFQYPERQPVEQKLAMIVKELIPMYQQANYTIQNFSRRRKQKSIVYSPAVDFQNTQWRLKIHPNGSQKAEGTHLSIFLELVKSVAKDSIYQYRIQISNPNNPQISFFRQYNSNFEQNGSCWGYINYMKLQDLARGQYLYNDCLNIKYSIRHPSYYHLSVFQEKYCQQLDSELYKQQDMIMRLEEDIEFSR